MIYQSTEANRLQEHNFFSSLRGLNQHTSGFFFKFLHTALVVSNGSIKMYLNYLPLTTGTVMTKQNGFFLNIFGCVCLKINQNLKLT